MRVWVASVKTEDGYELRRIAESAIDPQEGWTIKEQEHQSHLSGKDGVEVRTLGVTHFDSRTGTLVPD